MTVSDLWGFIALLALLYCLHFTYFMFFMLVVQYLHNLGVSGFAWEVRVQFPYVSSRMLTTPCLYCYALTTPCLYYYALPYVGYAMSPIFFVSCFAGFLARGVLYMIYILFLNIFQTLLLVWLGFFPPGGTRLDRPFFMGHVTIHPPPGGLHGQTNACFPFLNYLTR